MYGCRILLSRLLGCMANILGWHWIPPHTQYDRMLWADHFQGLCMLAHMLSCIQTLHLLLGYAMYAIGKRSVYTRLGLLYTWWEQLSLFADSQLTGNDWEHSLGSASTSCIFKESFLKRMTWKIPPSKLVSFVVLARYHEDEAKSVGCHLAVVRLCMHACDYRIK